MNFINFMKNTEVHDFEPSLILITTTWTSFPIKLIVAIVTFMLFLSIELVLSPGSKGNTNDDTRYRVDKDENNQERTNRHIDVRNSYLFLTVRNLNKDKGPTGPTVLKWQLVGLTKVNKM